MYNWSVDEKKFKNVEGVVAFLRGRPEVRKVGVCDNFTIKVRLVKNIHPAMKFALAKTVQEKLGVLPVSIIEEREQEHKR